MITRDCALRHLDDDDGDEDRSRTPGLDVVSEEEHRLLVVDGLPGALPVYF